MNANYQILTFTDSERRVISPECMGSGREMNHQLFPHLPFKGHLPQLDSKLSSMLSLGFCFVYFAPEMERNSVPLKKEGKYMLNI